jgi:hypothetical protein
MKNGIQSVTKVEFLLMLNAKLGLVLLFIKIVKFIVIKP